jgi:Glycosyl hydrolase catalytic core
VIRRRVRAQTRGRMTVASLLGGLALMLGSGSAAEAHVSPKFWGVYYRSSDIGRGDLRRMDQGKVGTVRRMLSWPQVEGSLGHFDWSVPDRIIGALASRGIRVLPYVYGSPAYAADEVTTPPLDSDSARREWTTFLQRAVNRYGPGGYYWSAGGPYHSRRGAGAPEEPIRAWQIWNEPNLFNYFTPEPSASKYATLLRISHDAIKGQHPHAKIVLAGMPGLIGLTTGLQFLDDLYKQGIKRDFDVAALHPYSESMQTFSFQMNQYRSTMRRYGDGHTPLWITEMGWGSARPDGHLNIGLRGQKRMLRTSFRRILRNRKRWHIGRVIWFEWRDPPPDIPDHGGCSFCLSSGLFRHALKPKPAWSVYRHFTGAAS